MIDPSPETPTPDLEPEGTGVEEVDDVISSLEGLDERPVEEHPAVFERAHERLRQALDSPAGS
jgi:hypothetical protein